MQFPIPVIVDIPDDQVERYAAITEIPWVDGRLRAKDVVAKVRDQVTAAASRDFLTLGIQADVSIKTR